MKAKPTESSFAINAPISAQPNSPPAVAAPISVVTITNQMYSLKRVNLMTPRNLSLNVVSSISHLSLLIVHSSFQ